MTLNLTDEIFHRVSYSFRTIERTAWQRRRDGEDNELSASTMNGFHNCIAEFRGSALTCSHVWIEAKSCALRNRGSETVTMLAGWLSFCRVWKTRVQVNEESCSPLCPSICSPTPENMTCVPANSAIIPLNNLGVISLFNPFDLSFKKYHTQA